MTQERVHRAVSPDGTEIVGRVEGEGPPLVLVHGGVDDGDTSWSRLLPRLTHRFTCYLPSTRGRGSSADHPDHSPERLVADVTAFVESVGEPVGLVGESSGAVLALGAAGRSGAISAVAAYEPPALEALGSEDADRFETTIGRVAELVEAGKNMEAGRAFMEAVLNEEELTAISSTPYFQDIAPYMPILLEEVRQEMREDATSPTHPSVLERIDAPVLLLQGSETALPWFRDAVRYVAGHVPHARSREVAGVGHAAPAMGHEAVAGELIRFFQPSPAGV